MKNWLWLIAVTLPAQDITTGLVAHWRMDENSGAIASDSASPGKIRTNPETGASAQDYGKYPATLTNTEWIGGQFGSALKFNGNAKAVTPVIPMGRTFSISAWVAPSSEAVNTPYSYLRIAETAYDTGFMLGFDMSGTKWKLILNSGAGTSGGCSDAFGCVSGGKPVAGKWQLVTATYDGSMARLYQDGIQVAQDTAAGRESTSLPLSIGAYGYYPGAGYDWRGGIDDVRLYDRALSVAEVAALYNQAAQTRLPPLQISQMLCKESTFLGHGTRALTCSMQSPNNTAWRGTLQARIDRPQEPNQPAFYASHPVAMRKDGNWAITAIAIYDRAGVAPPRVLGVDFYGTGVNGRYEHHSNCEPNCPTVVYQALDYPCPRDTPCMSGLYPAPLTVTDVQCEVAGVDSTTRSVTCGIAGNTNYYGGTLTINFSDGTQDSQLVGVEQPYVDGTLSYWGVVGVATTSSQMITNVEFTSSGPIGNWTPEKTQAYPPPTGTKSKPSIWCRWFGHGCKSAPPPKPVKQSDLYVPTLPAEPPPSPPPEVVAYEKVYFQNRFCDPDSCLRPPG